MNGAAYAKSNGLRGPFLSTCEQARAAEARQEAAAIQPMGRHAFTITPGRKSGPSQTRESRRRRQRCCNPGNVSIANRSRVFFFTISGPPFALGLRHLLFGFFAHFSGMLWSPLRFCLFLTSDLEPCWWPASPPLLSHRQPFQYENSRVERVPFRCQRTDHLVQVHFSNPF